MPTKAKSPRKPGPTGNQLLAMLPRGEYARLAPSLEPTSLELKQPLTEVGRPISHVVFPTTAVASILIVMADGAEVECGMIGPEGMVGLSVAFGLDFALYRTICQVPGEAWRMPARAFREARQRGRPLDALIQRYAMLHLRRTAQMVACNALHPAAERLCRWLLMSHDRVGRDEFPMTQEFMSELLGVHRPSVTLIAGTLQEAGLISYRRGLIRIRDRRRLEEASCECYAVLKGISGRILG
jgi:CRP-like cAMP-binding protein